MYSLVVAVALCTLAAAQFNSCDPRCNNGLGCQRFIAPRPGRPACGVSCQCSAFPACTTNPTRCSNGGVCVCAPGFRRNNAFVCIPENRCPNIRPRPPVVPAIAASPTQFDRADEEAQILTPEDIDALNITGPVDPVVQEGIIANDQEAQGNPMKRQASLVDDAEEAAEDALEGNDAAAEGEVVEGVEQLESDLVKRQASLEDDAEEAAEDALEGNDAAAEGEVVEGVEQLESDLVKRQASLVDDAEEAAEDALEGNDAAAEGEVVEGVEQLESDLVKRQAPVELAEGAEDLDELPAAGQSEVAPADDGTDEVSDETITM